MAIPLFQVDAFTSEPFKGNPAGVCLLRGPAEAAWMQSVAAEMNLAETAFPLAEGDGFRLRWFTPKVEVKLCGHATLATAHVLWEQGIVSGGREVRFQTLSGLLTARRDGELVELDFPARPPLPKVPDWAEAVVGALGVKRRHRPERGGHPVRGGRRRGGALGPTRLRHPPGAPGAGRHRHESVVLAGLRFRLALLRPGRRASTRTR